VTRPGFLRRLARTRLGVVIVCAFLFVAIFGPALAPYDPEAIDLQHQYELPSSAHLLGTTDNGVDLLSALLHGARLAAIVGVLVVAISLVAGALLGAAAGYRGGATDHAVSGAADVVQAFPAIVLNIAILALVARPGLLHLVVALVSNRWVLYARIARAQTFSLREREFVQAARALGAGEARIVTRHIMPNLAGPLVIQATSGFGGAILAEATLSFLGLGPGTASSWGALLEQGSSVLLRFPHVALVSGSAIAITVLGFNLAGDWLSDRLDPRTT
jgi:peptide/nickel transport system permease protein